MNTCDTCKHWTPVENSGHDLKYYSLQPGSGCCRKEFGSFADVLPDSIYYDGRQEDGTGEMITGPKFGCIHWEKKE